MKQQRAVGQLGERRAWRALREREGRASEMRAVQGSTCFRGLGVLFPCLGLTLYDLESRRSCTAETLERQTEAADSEQAHEPKSSLSGHKLGKGIAGGFCSQSSNAGPSWASGKSLLDPADARRHGIALGKVRSNSLPSPPPDGSLPLSIVIILVMPESRCCDCCFCSHIYCQSSRVGRGFQVFTVTLLLEPDAVSPEEEGPGALLPAAFREKGSSWSFLGQPVFLGHSKDKDFHSDNWLMVSVSCELCEAQCKMKTLGPLFKRQEKRAIKGTKIESLFLSLRVFFLARHDVFNLLLNVFLSEETLQF